MPFRDLRFLVVEDHPFQRAVMVRLLQSLGAAATHVADDGMAAIEVIRDPARPVDIVISDVSMPRMDGLEFVRRLTELGAPVSLIVSSALDHGTLQGVAAMARAYGARLLGVIGKPPTATKLLPLVEAHAGVRRDSHGRDFTLEEIATSWVSGDFHLGFEPQVALKDRRLLAMRAVPRWRHPDLGVLASDAFEAAIRSRGLQSEFAWFLLDGALGAARIWQDRGLDVEVAVPLLLDDLTDVSVAGRILHEVQGKDLEAQHVTLCLRAEAFSGDPRVLENVARLRVQGFELAVEGWTSWPQGVAAAVAPSLSQLWLAPDAVQQAMQDKAARASLQRLVASAKNAGLRCVAAGVDSEAEWKMTQSLGCAAAQGAFVSEPVPARDILRWALQWQSQAAT